MSAQTLCSLSSLRYLYLLGDYCRFRPGCCFQLVGKLTPSSFHNLTSPMPVPSLCAMLNQMPHVSPLLWIILGKKKTLKGPLCVTVFTAHLRTQMGVYILAEQILSMENGNKTKHKRQFSASLCSLAIIFCCLLYFWSPFMYPQEWK